MKKTTLVLMCVCSLCFGQVELGQAIDLVNTKQYDKALILINTFLRGKNDHRAHFIKAIILVHKKHFNKAIPHIEKAIALKKDKADYYQLAGLLYEQTNNTKSAIQAWEKCHDCAKDTRLFVESKHHIHYLKKK